MLNTQVIWDVMLCQWTSYLTVFQRIVVPSSSGSGSPLLLDTSRKIAWSWRQRHYNPLKGWEIPNAMSDSRKLQSSATLLSEPQNSLHKKCCSTGHMKEGLCYLLTLKHQNCGSGTHSRHRRVSEFFCGCVVLCTQKPCNRSVPHLSRPTNCIQTRFRNP
jgi:hypothetical protein